MLPIALQYNVLAGGQALDSTLQAVVDAVVAAMTAAFTEIKGATWSATDTLEQIKDASGGGSGLDAAGVRAAIGLASANLDTQLSAIDTAVGAVQADIAALDAPDNASITAIKAKTDALTIAGGNVAANIKAVNDLAVDGSGTEEDPWGPE